MSYLITDEHLIELFPNSFDGLKVDLKKHPILSISAKERKIKYSDVLCALAVLFLVTFRGSGLWGYAEHSDSDQTYSLAILLMLLQFSSIVKLEIGPADFVVALFTL